MSNLLANLSSGYFEYGVKAVNAIELNWIGQIIKALIEGIGIVGVGIIVFTLILKTIVLPLDIYSRITTKKQALIMEKMRPQMEKLQHQYANDQTMYNQKVMELQKKNGYSMFGACIPMLVSLVIFIVVFNAFSSYSQFANLESYNGMVKAYNGVVNEYVISDSNPNGFLVKETDGEDVKFLVDFDKFTERYNKDNSQNLAESDVFLKIAKEYKTANPNSQFNPEVVLGTGKDAEEVKLSLVGYYLEMPAAQAAAKYYQENNNSFLWVRNIWYPDSMLTKEIPDFASFQKTVSQAKITADYEQSYNRVTGALVTEKDTFNGYFVFIILSIGFMLLSQAITMKANKSVNELGTVDGSGASTNKYMMIMMPIIYGIFSFFYSASFSIYMVTNTVYSIITTLIINKIIEVRFVKKEEAEEHERMQRRGRRK